MKARSFWLTTSLEAAAALLVLAFLPSDVENRVFLAYSLPRLAMITLALALGLACAFLALRSSRSSALAGRFERILEHPVSVAASWVASAALVGLILALVLLHPSSGRWVQLLRALPLLAWAALFAVQAAVLQRWLGAPGPVALWEQLTAAFERLAQAAARALCRSAFSQGLALVVAALLLGAMALRDAFPTGYAGLFALMSDLLAQNHYLLPAAVPYYGPGGMPFSYPPAGLYLMAIGTHLLHLSDLNYLRLAPAFFTLLALVPYQALVAHLLSSPDSRPAPSPSANLAAAAAALLLATSPRLYLAQGEAAGVTRALGFLFSLCAMYFALRMFRSTGPRALALNGGLAALSTALTILSHLNYLALLCVGLGALLLSERGPQGARRPFWRRVLLAGAVGLGGLLLSSPWWAYEAVQNGPAIFLNATFSHGNFSSSLSLDFPARMLDSLAPLYRTPVLAAGLVLGFFYHLLQRRWFFPLCVLGVLALSLGDWLVAPFAAAMTAEVIVVLARLVAVRAGRLIPAALFLLLVVGAGCLDGQRQLSTIRPVIGEQTLAAADWGRANTPPGTTYLFFTTSADEAEWLPWLMQRTPVTGSWGAEWKGDYRKQLDMLNEVSSCAGTDPRSCSARLVARWKPAALVASARGAAPDLVAALSALPGWKVVYQDATYTFWLQE